MAKISENSRKVLEFVKGVDGKANVTLADVAEGTGLTSRQANGCIVAFQKKKMMERVETEIEQEDGTHANVKYIVLTDIGREFDPDAADKAEDAE